MEETATGHIYTIHTHIYILVYIALEAPMEKAVARDLVVTLKRGSAADQLSFVLQRGIIKRWYFNMKHGLSSLNITIANI